MIIPASEVTPFKHQVRLTDDRLYDVVQRREINGRVVLTCSRNLIMVRLPEDLLTVEVISDEPEPEPDPSEPTAARATSVVTASENSSRANRIEFRDVACAQGSPL